MQEPLPDPPPAPCTDGHSFRPFGNRLKCEWCDEIREMNPDLIDE